MPISYKNKIYTTLGTPKELFGNVVSTTDSAGVPAKDYIVKGRTIVWNQLWDKSKYTATKTIAGVTFTNNGDGAIIANGTATADAIFAPIGLSNPTPIVSGHKFLFISCPSGGSLSTYYSDLKDVPGDHSFYDVGIGVIMTAASTVTGLRFNIRVRSGYTANNLVFKPKLFDLTQMFGAGNEPVTVDEFRAMFPDDYYPYNEGELKTIVPTRVEASGVERFQMLDKSKYPGTTTKNGVAFTNNGDGTITANGTAAEDVYYNLVPPAAKSGHKYMLYGCPTGGSSNTYDIVNTIYRSGRYSGSFSDMGNGAISRALEEGETFTSNIFIAEGYTANNLVFKPQLFDLTQMFGAGNEPATVAEFWQRVPEKLYGYNPNDYKSANIPSSKYFPDGMKSAGSVYDEINFLSQKAIKRVGIRAYQTGDENDANVMTDKTNTVYELATPVETIITPPLQALPTYKGFTSFSAPNSLTQNGPLSVTYYAEGGANPEKGWLTSYKRKLYMGRNIEWNQLFTNSAKSSNGVTISQNQDGTMTLNGTANKAYINFTNLSDAMNQVHKYLLYLKILNNPGNVSFYYSWLNRNSMCTGSISTGESCVVCNQTTSLTQLGRGNGLTGFAAGTVFNNVKIAMMVMDLTQMFGAGNEPATPAEFWTYFDHKLYPYNPGETQPLFKISRKSQWGEGSGLPTGYRRCSYLQGIGNDTTYFVIPQIDITNSPLVLLECMYQTYLDDTNVFGSILNDIRFEQGIGWSGRAFSYNYGNGYGVTGLGVVNAQTENGVLPAKDLAGKRLLFEYKNDTFYLNGIEQTIAKNNIYANGSLGIAKDVYLFGTNRGETKRYFNGKIYRFFVENQINLIPALDKNGVPCMFDLISKSTFYNQGTGEFLYELA